MLTSLLAITSGCQTTVEVTVQPIILDPFPIREEIPDPPISLADADQEAKDWVADTLNYYEELVQKWESWGLAVKDSNGE